MKVYFYAENKDDAFTPLNIAKALIDTGSFSDDNLMELSEYLMTYAKHNKGESNDHNI